MAQPNLKTIKIPRRQAQMARNRKIKTGKTLHQIRAIRKAQTPNKTSKMSSANNEIKGRKITATPKSSPSRRARLAK